MNTPFHKLRSLAATAAMVAGFGLITAATAAAASAGEPPMLSVGSAFVDAGGGPGSFSSVRASEAMFGQRTVQHEFVRLRRAYGARNLNRFVKIYDFAVNDAWQRAGQDNVGFPPPASLAGKTLALALVKAGTSGHDTFSFGRMLGTALTPRVAHQVTRDITARFGAAAEARFSRMADAAFVDFARTLGNRNLRSAASGTSS